MHILFLSDNFPPEVNAPASRTFEHTKEWVIAGHEVTVITCAPNFPKGEVFSGYENKLWHTETIEGVRVIRVWSYITRNEGFAKRVLDYMSFMLTSFLAAFFVRKVDIVIGTSPQFFTACAAWGAAAIKRCPFVFELRDIWPESIRAVGAMKDSKALELLEKVELFLYRRADAIIAVTDSFKRNLVERQISEAKIHVVTNGVDLARFSPQDKDPILLRELELNGKFVAGYVGTHGMAHALETLVEAAELLKLDPELTDVVILMMGDGANRNSLMEQAKHLDNIIFLESVSKEDVARRWSLLDASIIHLKKSDLFKTVIPSKMFECMAMGIPILHGVEGESAEIIEHYNTGLLFEPENAQALCSALKKLHSDRAMYKQFEQNGLKCANDFNRKVLAKNMIHILQDL
ncbi:MAG: glycosyltransferase family 4 protein [Rhodobacterales bacterium]